VQAFTRQVKLAFKKHKISVADLRWFFGRDYKTVREWIVNDRQPEGARRDEALSRAASLERFLAAGFLPAPLWLKKRDRAEYMRVLGEGNLERAGAIIADATRDRLADPSCKNTGRKTVSDCVP
jgi:hypothetical protein